MNVGDTYYSREIHRRTDTKLELPSVTLLCGDGIHIDYSIPALERCKALCNFGAVKLLTSMPSDYEHRVEIQPLDSLNAYSTFMLKDAYRYVDTTHCLVAQHDGWILNQDAWDPAWLQCDYIGPLFIHNHVTAATSVGSGGFSLRSKRLMEYVAGFAPGWDGSLASADAAVKQAGAYEDGFIAIGSRGHLEGAGFVFGTPAQASRFAQGGNNDAAYYTARPFGFHGLWANINAVTGEAIGPFPR